ncbi:Rieske 2Fe-2S domain-containing protein [Streptacidiphilus sp. EB129]|uniref:Rieske 2Fe-2S domain-containing protein n=1 Tax=Streptacidiphilus sp. EB129 TaxID=3156262 RepID=UPI003513888C
MTTVQSAPLAACAVPAHAVSGWYLIAFADELTAEVTPLSIGGHALLAVRRGADIRVFDAICPHRGANLAHGGAVSGDAVICPFHGKAVALGDTSRRWSVAEHHVHRVGDAVFVRIGDDDRGFASVLAALDGRRLVAGLVREVAVAPSYVIENAFDIGHFSAVHKVPRVVDLGLRPGEHGELAVEALFETGAPAIGGDAEPVRSRFCARAYSPHLVVSELGPAERSHLVITGAVPTPAGCTARVAYALAPDEPESTLHGFIRGGELAFEQDQVVWEHLDPSAPARYDAGDVAVLAFQAFRSTFAGSTGGLQ